MNDRLTFLNEKYSGLTPAQRIEEIFKDFDPEKVLVTSSFGTSSVFLLNLISKIRKEHKIYFIDTGYLFRETFQYRDELQKLFGLNIVTLRPEPVDHDFTKRHQTWMTDPDFCCSINKVSPLEEIKPGFEIWMSGLLTYQGSNRENLKIFEYQDLIKFNPILDVPKNTVIDFVKANHFPEHPLVSKGYGSVGCTHCTRPGDNRSGRWPGLEKTECGLHTEISL